MLRYITFGIIALLAVACSNSYGLFKPINESPQNCELKDNYFKCGNIFGLMGKQCNEKAIRSLFLGFKDVEIERDQKYGRETYVKGIGKIVKQNSQENSTTVNFILNQTLIDKDKKGCGVRYILWSDTATHQALARQMTIINETN